MRLRSLRTVPKKDPGGHGAPGVVVHCLPCTTSGSILRGLMRYGFFAGQVGDLVLLWLAHTLLRVRPPLDAHAVMLRLGSLLPTLDTPKDAGRLARSLRSHGSCLSRALAIAARTPAADVVIAVEPRQAAPLFAHAWIEIDGIPIDSSDVAGTVIARLLGRKSKADEMAAER